VRRQGHNGADLARLFNVNRSTISTGAERGRRLVEEDEALQAEIGNATK